MFISSPVSFHPNLSHSPQTCLLSADMLQHPIRVRNERREVIWRVSDLKIYFGIDMAKDKFDYCAMDDSLNILCRGSNRENRNERFNELSDLMRTLKSTGTMMKIGMESTGIYHIPLYNHLRTHGFPVRILNGLEVRGMKKSRVRKTTNDTIDAESIAKYLMIREEKDTFVVPENFRNIRGIITAYSIVVLNLLNSVSWW